MTTHSESAPKTCNHNHTAALVGWVSNQQHNPEVLSANTSIVSSLSTELEAQQLIDGRIACASTTKLFKSDNGVVAAIVGTPHWTDPELSTLAEESGHSAALSKAYSQKGLELFGYLQGGFSLAVIDLANNTLLLGIDRLGRYPMFYQRNQDGFFFGTSLASIQKIGDSGRTLRNQGIYDYVYFHMVPSPTTIFAGVRKLQAGCMLEVHEEGEKNHRYWFPEFKEKTTNTPQELGKKLKEELRSAVEDCIQDSGKVGAFLSGGLDSSTVTGMLAEVSEGPCDVYSIGFSAKGYDEMEYARITAKHFGARLHEYYVTPEDVVSALPLIATSYDEPFGNSSALPAYFCAKMAESDGVERLLAGDGGDEIFAGNERYAKQDIFERYHRLPPFLRTKLLEPAAFKSAWIPLTEKARSYIRQANTPLPDRLQSYNFLHRYQAEEVFRDSFLESINEDYPLELQREIYSTPKSATNLNRMLFLDWQFTLADNDLRKVSHMCSIAKVDVAYPMLEDRVIELSLNIPSEWKISKGNLRDFYKKSLADWLPAATISKKKQGFGLPFGVWMQTHKPLQEIAYDSILKLKERGIFRPEFLDKAIKLHREGHASYFGELVWILTVLELWMENHIGE